MAALVHKHARQRQLCVARLGPDHELPSAMANYWLGIKPAEGAEYPV